MGLEYLESIFLNYKIQKENIFFRIAINLLVKYSKVEYAIAIIFKLHIISKLDLDKHVFLHDICLAKVYVV